MAPNCPPPSIPIFNSFISFFNVCAKVIKTAYNGNDAILYARLPMVDKIVIAERDKSYLVKHVMEDNKVMLLKSYKYLCYRIGDIANLGLNFSIC